MDSKPFQFKHFSIAQDHSVHKVGTDGVLLGAWVKVGETDRAVLDIGTGTGVVALMLAQRACAEARIDAIEAEGISAGQARENVRRSPWPEKVVVHHTRVQEFLPQKKYDLIVSNPPYFVNSLLPPDKQRGRARHTNELPFEDLLTTAVRLLTESGRFCLILPYREALDFLRLAAGCNLAPLRHTSFRTRENKPVERLLLEFAFGTHPVECTEITLYSDGETWSEGYRALTSDFYLKA